jgi:hypothetical protein
MSRSDARRAWKMRSALSAESMRRFDEAPVAAMRQLSALYHDVLTWERPGREDIAELVATPSEGQGVSRHAL